MRLYQTPGVHTEVFDASAGGVAPLRTDVAAFVGLAERGPLHLAVPVESVRQFSAWFGEVFDNGYLAYCARAFFENGGRRLWVVRTASPSARPARLTLADAGGAAWQVQASSAGVWGNRLQLRLAEVRHTRSRGRLQPHDATALAVDGVAGFARFDLVELSRGAVRARAVVVAVDAAAGLLRLQGAPVPALPAGPLDVRVDTLAYDLTLYDAGLPVRVAAGLSLVPEHPRYGPHMLRLPWVHIDPRRPDAADPDTDPAAAAQADSDAQAWLHVARSRLPAAPPPIVIHELRDAARRAALLPLVGLGGPGGAGPLVPVAGAAPSPPVALQGGADGLAALTEHDFTGHDVAADASPLAVVAGRRGIAALTPVDEAALVAVPDIHIRPDPQALYLPPSCVPDTCLPMPPQGPTPPAATVGDVPPRFDDGAIARVQAALVAHCERRRDRFGLLDAPWSACALPGLATTGLREWRALFDTAFAALHAPWLQVVDPRRGAARRSVVRAIPPCGHVAGLMAAMDLKRGVHASAANQPLQWVQDLTLALDDERHGLLNSLGVDVVRAVPGRGIRLMGARTLSSDPDWRYVPVRRLVSMVARAIDVAIQWAVFEPNDWRTRMKLQLVIGAFLRGLWSRGALAGSAVEEAFWVRCDETNNPPTTRELGQLLIEVGLAPVVPMEFIVLRIGREAGGFAITEGEAGLSFTGEPLTAGV